MRKPLLIFLRTLLSIGVANAQRPVDWVTSGSDAQRSSWIRTDTKISRDSLKKPGCQFLWKLKLDSNAKQSFAAPVLLNSYIGYRGFRSLAYVGLTSAKVAAIDTDLGRIEWQRQLTGVDASSACGGLMTSLTRPTTAAFPVGGGGRGGGGGGGRGATSAVGEPLEGSVILKQVSANARPRPSGPTPVSALTPAPPPGGRPRIVSLLHTVTGDGMLHSLLVSNGEP